MALLVDVKGRLFADELKILKTIRSIDDCYIIKQFNLDKLFL